MKLQFAIFIVCVVGAVFLSVRGVGASDDYVDVNDTSTFGSRPKIEGREPQYVQFSFDPNGVMGIEYINCTPSEASVIVLNAWKEMWESQNSVPMMMSDIYIRYSCPKCMEELLFPPHKCTTKIEGESNMKHRTIKQSLDGQSWQKWEHTLSLREELESLFGWVKASIFGGCWANHVSADLEEKVCTHDRNTLSPEDTLRAS